MCRRHHEVVRERPEPCQPKQMSATRLASGAQVSAASASRGEGCGHMRRNSAGATDPDHVKGISKTGFSPEKAPNPNVPSTNVPSIALRIKGWLRCHSYSE